MYERHRPSRRLQRAARSLANERGISYQQARGALKAPGRSSLAATSTAWLKAIHFRHAGWTIAPHEHTWISDPGRRRSDGERVYRSDGTPWGEPSWQVGDRIGLYFTGTLKVPVLVEVVAAPEFNPGRVQAENDGGESDAGERWPWLTQVRGIARMDLAAAPSLEDIGVTPDLMRRRPKLQITAEHYARLADALR